MQLTAPAAQTHNGGSLLVGAFDEDESAASFQEALRAFRGENKAARNAGASAAASTGGVPAQRASRFSVPQPAAPLEPTLADKVAALKGELGLASDLSMVEAVAAANSAVGLDTIGSLADQVGRLLRETGIQVSRSAAPPPAAPTASSPGGGTASAGTSTAEAGGGRPSSSQGVMTTQTQPTSSFYERFLEQKRKDGVA